MLIIDRLGDVQMVNSINPRMIVPLTRGLSILLEIRQTRNSGKTCSLIRKHDRSSFAHYWNMSGPRSTPYDSSHESRTAWRSLDSNLRWSRFCDRQISR